MERKPTKTLVSKCKYSWGAPPAQQGKDNLPEGTAPQHCQAWGKEDQNVALPSQGQQREMPEAWITKTQAHLRESSS